MYIIQENKKGKWCDFYSDSSYNRILEYYNSLSTRFPLNNYRLIEVFIYV